MSDKVRSAHPIEKRREIVAMLGALEHGAVDEGTGVVDEETRQLFLEILLSALAELNQSLARLVYGAAVGSRHGKAAVPAATHAWMTSIYEGDTFDSGFQYSVDLFILAVKRIELDAVLDVFFPRAPEDQFPPPVAIESGKDLWIASFGRRSIGIGWMAEDGQAEAAIALSLYSSFVSFENACIIGTAGGKRGSVEQGDIVVATDVVDYDRRKVVPSTIESPGEFSTPPVDTAEWRLVTTGGNWRSQVTRLNDGEAGPVWRERIRASIPDWTKPPLRMAPIETEGTGGRLPKEWRGHILVKPILSGGALVEAEEELERLLTQYHPESVALDMESYGFAKWCQAHQIRKWVVVRCISDYCGPNLAGEARPKSWQYPATYIGARVLQEFLLRLVFGFVD